MKRKRSFFLIVLFIGIQSAFSQSKTIVQPAIGVAPLWVMAHYGLYWGVSLYGDVKIFKHHKMSVCADLAPVGLLGMTDVGTEGEEQHWGGTLSYLFQIELANELLRIEPGAALGLSSIPYTYGTWGLIDTSRSTPSTPIIRPERESVLSAGPELRLSLGRKRIQFFMDSRFLFAENLNIALLTNMGISFKL
jgi:hypothetical protein